MKTKVLPILLAMSFVLIFTGCQTFDVIGNGSVTSFKRVLDTVPDRIGTDEANGAWSLTAPDGSAAFIWSKDPVKSTGYDAMIVFDAKPFVDGGLDTARLSAGMFLKDKIIVGVDLVEETWKDTDGSTPAGAYEQIEKQNRDLIGYHGKMDHYGIKLGDGNMFEWAKDMSRNDKDIVFVLNPKPFIDAGADPEKVNGWLFAKVETMDDKGRTIEVDKLLKPFNLK